MTDSSAFDRTRLAMLQQLAGNTAELAPMMDEFVASARTRVLAIKAALATGDLPLIRKHAHPMKSGAATVGSVALAALCREIETAAAENNPRDLPESVARLDSLLADTVTWLAETTGLPLDGRRDYMP